MSAAQRGNPGIVHPGSAHSGTHQKTIQHIKKVVRFREQAASRRMGPMTQLAPCVLG